jgi:hypothetical protein
MRAHTLSLFVFCCSVSILSAPAHAARGAIAWETSLPAAKAKAARAGKPLLVLHLFGKLNEEFC